MTYWPDIVTAVLLLGMGIYGYSRGFLKLSISALAVIITLMAARTGTPMVCDYLKTHTGVYQSVQEKMLVTAGFVDNTAESAENAVSAPADNQIRQEEGVQDTRALPFSAQSKTELEKNNNSMMYRLLGATNFPQYVAYYMSDSLIRTLAFLILSVAVFALLRILIVALDLIAKLPVISGVNKTAGFILGLGLGLILLWTALLVLLAFGGTPAGVKLAEEVNKGMLSGALAAHNPLAELVLHTIHAGR